MSILSKIPQAPYNCYDIAHPTVESCAEHSAIVFYSAFRYCLMLYGGFYGFSRLGTGRFGLNDLLRTLPQVVQSSIFLSFNAFFFTLLICLESHLSKRITLLMPSVSGLISSLLAIHLEVPARRRLLAVYMLNITSETAYEFMLLHTNFKPIPYFVEVLYAVSLTAYIHRTTSAKDFLVKGFVFLTGTRPKLFTDQEDTPTTPPETTGFWNSLKRWLSISPHECENNNCVSHAAFSGARAFLLGQAVNLALSLPGLLRGSPLNRERGLRLGALLAITAAGTNGIQCLLANSSLSPMLSARTRLTMAVFVSSFGIAIYPSRRIVLHLFWRTLASYSRFDISPHPLPELTYAVCTAILAFFVVFEPQSLRKSYMSFLDRLAGDRLRQIFRHPLEIYSGCHSSKMYPDYFPIDKMKLSRVSPRFLEQVLVWSIQ